MSNDAYLVSLGAKIRHLRKDLGYSQEELADIIKSNRLTVLRIESGKVNSTINMLIEIAKALKVEIGDLVTL